MPRRWQSEEKVVASLRGSALSQAAKANGTRPRRSHITHHYPSRRHARAPLPRRHIPPERPGIITKGLNGGGQSYPSARIHRDDRRVAPVARGSYRAAERGAHAIVRDRVRSHGRPNIPARLPRARRQPRHRSRDGTTAPAERGRVDGRPTRRRRRARRRHMQGPRQRHRATHAQGGVSHTADRGETGRGGLDVNHRSGGDGQIEARPRRRGGANRGGVARQG